MNEKKFSREEPIPGYRTMDLLGRGGFGEVWRAVAPGGVSKAIKIVFGEDSTRAESELRSLNRIKDVRHPLVLSIDRIEIVNGTLVIVTELGDCNLKEYGRKFRDQGLPGIPQPELLRLIRDAGEALDYLYAEHSLQHLDVKPENFLVFGKHLKIADFGVVKHIYERSASVVHGLTPVYSAPELFEGKANRHTDQYSLAIVYQQMLTGQLPFDGLSPARLATQHMKEPPSIASLPEHQQPIIARALSKDPNQRYPSCVELVDELEAAGRKLKSSIKVVNTSPPKNESAEEPVVEPRGPQKPSQWQSDIAPKPFSLDVALDQVDQELASLSPTIVIGIGGTAAHVLQQLRKRINERVGHLQDVPALKLILIDTDVKQLNQVNRDEDVWKEIETVAAPLRRSEEYHAQDPRLKGWMNRRWLYNIPRDQSTDGIRALGRLALLSNHQRIFSAFDRALESALSEESRQKSSERLNRSFESAKPRVVIVTSLCGGTGGGMLFDIAYAVRTRLTEAGVSHDDVDALLLHSTGRDKSRDKATANAYAALQELAHFSTRGQYFPGDNSMKIDAFHGNNRTFRRIEVLPLGENLDEEHWVSAADDVSEYLYCSMLGSRNNEKASQQESPSGSEVFIRQLGAANRDYLEHFSSQICLELLDCWRGRELVDRNNTASFTQPTTFLNKVFAPNVAKHRQLSELLEGKILDLGLNEETLIQQARSTMEQELGSESIRYISDLVQQAISVELPQGKTRSEAAVSLIDKLLDSSEPADADTGENSLVSLLIERSQTFANQISSELKTFLKNLVDDPGSRVDGAHYAAEQTHAIVRDLLSSVARAKINARAKLSEMTLSISNEQFDLPKKRWLSFGSGKGGRLQRALQDYGETKLKTIELIVVHKQLRTLEAHVGTVIDQTQRLSHDITRLARKFQSTGECELPSASTQSYEESLVWYVQGVRDRLTEKRRDILSSLENRIENMLLENGDSLQKYLDSRTELSDVFLTPLREDSRDVVSQAVTEVHCELIDEPNSGEDGDLQAFRLPHLIQRVLKEQFDSDRTAGDSVTVTIPEQADADRLSTFLKEQDDTISVMPVVTNGISLIRKQPERSLYEFAQQMTRGAEVYQELASRLHTREDVKWLPLEPAKSPSAIEKVMDSPAMKVDQTAVLD